MNDTILPPEIFVIEWLKEGERKLEHRAGSLIVYERCNGKWDTVALAHDITNLAMLLRYQS